jgi:hypothetical protein
MSAYLNQWQTLRRQPGIRVSLLAVLFVLLLMMVFGGISSGAVDVPVPRVGHAW